MILPPPLPDLGGKLTKVVVTFQFRYRSLSLHLNSPTLLVNPRTRPVNSVPMESSEFVCELILPTNYYCLICCACCKIESFLFEMNAKVGMKKNICSRYALWEDQDLITFGSSWSTWLWSRITVSFVCGVIWVVIVLLKGLTLYFEV